MSLSSILSSGLTGLQAAQTQLQVVSQNVTNADTPGYIRKIAQQEATVTEGVGTGVDIASIQLASNVFLQSAARNAGSAASQADALNSNFSQLQALFGDPTDPSSFFNQTDALFSSFSSLAENPTSTPQRQATLTNAQTLFSQAASIAQGIQTVRTNADTQISTDVNQVNSLLSQIEQLNVQISRATTAGSDATGAQSNQQTLIGQLSQLMGVTVQQRADGGVMVRTTDGQLLAGDGAATLTYTPSGVVTPQTSFNQVILTPPNGAPMDLTDHISGGEIAGLLQLRDQTAPQAASQLAELTSGVADQLNKVSNANTASPPPQTLTGQNVGLDLTSAISGFAGKTTIALVDSSGVAQHQVAIDFTNGTMSLDGGGTATFSPSTFLSTLNTTMAGNGTASFSNGVLSLSGAAGLGVAVSDDATTPSSNAGKGFSWYFGLNNVISSSQLTNYNTSLTAASANQFAAGGQMQFQFTSPQGSLIKDITVSIPSGGTMANVLSALNSPTSGVGRFGTFALDSNGALNFTPSISPAATLSVLNDTTSWGGASGPTLNALFGVDAGLRANRAINFSVNTGMIQNPNNLPIAKLNLSAAAGTPAVVSGDGTGAQAFANVGEAQANFASIGQDPGGVSSIDNYASRFAGSLGQQAASFSSASSAADALQTQANSQLSSAQGVNLDQELTNLTMYQQAYNASARLIQAAKDMGDVLISIVSTGA
ncbi:MAG TPA: flagellar hook-associated protein FlgK [Caulobacteraceae bacterium]|jgi:flagellar hook-associated protein 1 FlgK|nr:flagellar hook-associated protein FlgK [Caulobacteraceae bacterium]